MSRGSQKSVAVIGGGIAGIQCALDLASVGIKVYLVERTASVGGHMAMLDKTFPTNDCSMCILAPKMIECFRSAGVKLLTCSDVEKVSGGPGDMHVVVRRSRLEVDETKCTGCGDCAAVCPVALPSEFDGGLGKRRAVSKAFAQAVPNVFRIDRYGEVPCRDACPAGLSTQAYCALVAAGRFSDALKVVLDAMPLPGVCGRVCPHPCEEACNRKEVDDPVGLCALKRAAADFGWDDADPPSAPPLAGLGRTGKVAIVGSGPAGLAAAYDLARMGHDVTVFEARHHVGGMLFYGIPKWRLPREILEREVGLVRRLGVKILMGVEVGKDVSYDALFAEGYEAIFVAAGAHRNAALRIGGEESEGVVAAVEFLRKVNSGQEAAVGRRVVVIGGGNAAVDAARAALRLGAEDVMIAYRRTRREMPALPWEVDAAEEEGVRLMLLAAPSRILSEGGKVTGLELLGMTLGDPDESGRRRPLPLPGAEFVVGADMIVSAVGQVPEIDGIRARGREVEMRGGLVVADPETQATSVPGVFAGGDVTTGPATVIKAVAAGKRAARGIDAYINGAAGVAKSAAAGDASIVKYGDVIARLKGRPEPARSVRTAFLEPGSRRRTFEEVEAGYTREQAIAEAARCLACGGCCRCGSCTAACEAKAIDLRRREETITLDVDACVLAFGFDLMPASAVAEYGYGRLKDVITAMELERLLSASGPTAGEVLRPSDGGHPKKIAFIQCVGSRDFRHHRHCSAVCCMHAAKEAILLREHDGEAGSLVFYTDIRAYGKGFQDYIQRAREEYGVSFVRGRPGRVTQGEGGKLVVAYEDTARRQRGSMEVDLVVLCNAMIPPAFGRKIGEIFGVETTPEGFVGVPDPLSLPCGTSRPGVFACGFCVGPKDIPDSVIEATSAASTAACLVLDKTTTPPR